MRADSCRMRSSGTDTIGRSGERVEFPDMKRFFFLSAVAACGWMSIVSTVHPQQSNQAAAAAPQAPAAPPPGRGAPGTESGWATFQNRCSICHGNPSNERAASPAAIRDVAPEKIYDALVSGSTHAQLQGLSDAQKKAVAEFM